jgi:hypothetical protein
VLTRLHDVVTQKNIIQNFTVVETLNHINRTAGIGRRMEDGGRRSTDKKDEDVDKRN